MLKSNKEKEERLNTVIAGSENEYNNIMLLLKEAGMNQRVFGRVAVDEKDTTVIGYWKKMQQLSDTIPFKEVIFCEGGLSFKDIIEGVQQQPTGVITKIHADGSSSIVGSDSKDSSGESLSKENGYKLSNPYNRRLKRLIDVSVAFFSILTFPVHLFIVSKPASFFSNCLSVLLANKTWIGYAVTEKHLPKLYTGVVASNGVPVSATQQLPAESLQMMDYWYARDYEPIADLKLIWRAYKKLGG